MHRFVVASCALILAWSTPCASQEPVQADPTNSPAAETEARELLGTDAKEAEPPTAEAPIVSTPSPVEVPLAEAGTSTRGGLVEGAKILHVTTLADKGPGSLRAAIAHKGPRVIVFDVGGIISLSSDIRIAAPYVTVAGQMAPAPGITLLGAQLRIKTHDVVLQHLSVFPVLAPETVFGKDVDAISIYSCEDCSDVTDIRLENISVGWATDEIIGLWGKAISRITLRNSLIAEGLNVGTGTDDPHSMGLLIGASVEGVEVAGNLFASNKLRNPVVGGGASAFIANNFVYNPGLNSVHVYGDRAKKVTRVSVIGNVVKRGPSTREEMSAVQLPHKLKMPALGARFFAEANYCCTGEVNSTTADQRVDQTFVVPSRPVEQRSWTMLDAGEVWQWVAKHAGSRPADRSPNDRRIFAYVASGDGAIISDPKEVGGYGTLPRREAASLLPTFPFSPAPDGLRAKTRLEAWLCLRHFDVGGPATSECPDGQAALRTAFKTR